MRIRSAELAKQFNSLAGLEPLLGSLMREAASTLDAGDESFCANRLWYQRFKPRLEAIVGWHRQAGPDVLKTAEAYDAAYEAIYMALPDCRNCFACMRTE
jgi:hypothetical protein